MNDFIPFKNVEELSKFLEKEETQENEKLEFKEQINHIKKSDIKKFIDTYFEFNIVKAIYAMANTKGGNVLIGISDNKEIIGIKERDVEYLKEIIKEIDVIDIRIEELKSEKGRMVLNIKVKPVSIYQKAIIKKGTIY